MATGAERDILGTVRYPVTFVTRSILAKRRMHENSYPLPSCWPSIPKGLTNQLASGIFPAEHGRTLWSLPKASMPCISRLSPYLLMASLGLSLISLSANAQPEETQTGSSRILSERQHKKDDSGWYMEGTIGQFGLVVGRALGPIRLEGSVYSSFYGAPGSSTVFISGLGSIYYYFLSASRWSPYLGGGLGYGVLSSNDDSPSSNSGLVYRLGCGLSYAFNKSWDGNIQFNSSAITIEGPESLGLGGTLGFRYWF